MPATLQTLSTEAHIQYQKDGFYIARNLFNTNEISHLRDSFTKAVAEGPIPGLSNIDRITDQADPLWQYGRLMHPHLFEQDPTLQSLAMNTMLDERIERILYDLFQEEALAAQSMVYFKPPGARGQDFHQDNFYLRIKPGTCMAAWLAMDDADAENGGLMVVPGSHKLDILCPQATTDTKTFFTKEHLDTPEGMEQIQTELKAGDCLFFNGSLIHGSLPNTSQDRFRRAFICHYAPISCKESSDFYELFDFKAQKTYRETNQDGGPCGTVVAMTG